MSIKPILRINTSSARSFEKVRAWLITFGVIALIAGIAIFFISEFEAGWELIGVSIPLFLLAGCANGMIEIATAAAVFNAKVEEEYEIKAKKQE